MMHDDGEPGFRTNLVIIAIAHIAVLAGLGIFARHWKPKPAEQITWLDGGGDLAAPASAPKPADATVEPEPIATPAPAQPPPPPTEPPPSAPAEIPDRKRTPEPTPKPAPTPLAKKQTPTPKPSAKNQTPPPRKIAQQAKTTTPKPVERTAKPAPARETVGTEEASKQSTGHADTQGTRGGPGAPGGSVSGAEKLTYFKLVGARFREGWNPPLTTIATGRDLIATLRIKVGADGAVRSAVMTEGTGNREMDASVEAAIPHFTKVPPPPSGLLVGGVLDTQMAVVLDL